VISPLLANLYMNRMLKDGVRPAGGAVSGAHRELRGRPGDSQSRQGERALGWLRGALERLELNEREEDEPPECAAGAIRLSRVYIRPHFSGRTGREYIGYSPSRKSVSQMRRSRGRAPGAWNHRPWEEVRDRLNQKTERLGSILRTGSTARAYRAIDEYVEERVRFTF